MGKLEAMKIFLEVAKSESFISASDKLGMSPSAVTRSVAALETQLNIRLFNRTTRRVRLTESGKRFAQDCKTILESVDEAEAAAAGTYAEPQGELNITAPVQFGEKFIIPIITEYLQTYPKVSVKALFYDHVTSLVEEELDIAIRIGHLPDSSLYAKQVGQIRRVVCAAPDYLEQHGRPQKPSDLNQHRLILPTASDTVPVWHFAEADKKKTIRFTPVLRCNQIGSTLAAAKQGLGITRLLSYQVAADLESGNLERVLTEFEEAPMPVNIMHLEGRRTNAKIRSFIDLAEAHLKGNPHLA